MSVRFEITTEPGTVAPGDLVVLRLVTQKGGVKWTCGIVRCFTDDEDQSAIVLNTGRYRSTTATRWCAASSPYPTKCKWR